MSKWLLKWWWSIHLIFFLDTYAETMPFEYEEQLKRVASLFWKNRKQSQFAAGGRRSKATIE